MALAIGFKVKMSFGHKKGWIFGFQAAMFMFGSLCACPSGCAVEGVDDCITGAACDWPIVCMGFTACMLGSEVHVAGVDCIIGTDCDWLGREPVREAHDVGIQNEGMAGIAEYCCCIIGVLADWPKLCAEIPEDVEGGANADQTEVVLAVGGALVADMGGACEAFN